MKGTLFENTKLSFLQILTIMYFFVCRYPVVMSAQMIGVDKNTVSNWYFDFRTVAQRFVNRIRKNGEGMIGGPALVVEIDESHLYKAKNNAGHGPAYDIWVFGGVCIDGNGNKEIFIEQVIYL